MNIIRIRFFAFVLFVALFLSGIYTATNLNSDFGKLEVKVVGINDGNKEISGLIYRPYAASANRPYPAIVIAHGISESKEMMSNLGLELARRGFVVLCLDLLGHGKSGGTVEEGANEPSFGVLAAVSFLKAQPFVNSSEIGLVGHSLGGGAVRAADVQDSQIKATVLIAGGLGDVARGPVYGVINSTFPKNLLVIVGKYDVLFNLTDLTTKELTQAFSAQEVTPDIVYGSFQSQTARKLVTPATTHLFEPVDPTTVSETVKWMEESLKTVQSSGTGFNASLVYVEREVAILVALIGLLGAIILFYFPLASIFRPRPKNGESKGEFNAVREWRAYTVWAALNLVLFFPMIGIGFIISFPPLIFGSSIAWWVLAVGLISIFLITKNKPRLSETKIKPGHTVIGNFERNECLIVIILFILLLTVASLLDLTLNINLRIFAPIFQSLTSARRILAFFSFLPFFTIYFLAEGLYFHELHSQKSQKSSYRTDTCDLVKLVFSKVSPFLVVIGLQYVPKVLFNIWLLPSLIGFIAEFLWLIVLIFIITTVFSWWFHRITKRTGIGVIFNTLMLAWISAVVFPL